MTDTLTLIEGSKNANILFAKITKNQKDGLANLEIGEAVYQTDNSPGIQVYNGTNWDSFATLSGASFTGPVSDSKGNVRSIPQNLQTSLYTLVASDNGKHICMSGDTITIPANVFNIGDNVQIFNNTAYNVGILCSNVTAYIAGVNTTKTTVTLATRGRCEILFYEQNKVVISGNVS